MVRFFAHHGSRPTMPRITICMKYNLPAITVELLIRFRLKKCWINFLNACYPLSIFIGSVYIIDSFFSSAVFDKIQYRDPIAIIPLLSCNSERWQHLLSIMLTDPMKIGEDKRRKKIIQHLFKHEVND